MKGAKEKLEKLKEILAEMGGVVIAFSGGVDSTFLLRVAKEALGERALAVTARSETYPSREAEEAAELASWLGTRQVEIDTEELAIEGYADNPPERCFYCKGELFSKLLEIAKREGLAWVADGSNVDDAGDWRPGRKAGEQLGVRSPLREAGLNKEEIRALSRELGLPTWDKPSFACLASRFPYGTRITAEKLRRVEAAEEFLRSRGLRQVRVRHHDSIARIEVPAESVARLAEPGLREAIVERLKELGYTYVTLDLEGYRSGSMNEPLKTGTGG